jgi:DNA-binding GntR family transcriptional regulator
MDKYILLIIVIKGLKSMYNLPKLNLNNYKPLRDVVFDNLRESILTGKLKPGQRLMEIQLAEGLGVSRTPVREAIRKLELEDLVVMLPRKGAYVTNMSLKEILDVLEVRATLESLAAKLAAKRRNEKDIENLKQILKKFKKITENNKKDMVGISEIDIELHHCIFRIANNKSLTKTTKIIWEKEFKFRLSYMNEYDMSPRIADEHEKLIKAIIDGDDKVAEKYALTHIKNSEEYIINNAMLKHEDL